MTDNQRLAAREEQMRKLQSKVAAEADQLAKVKKWCDDADRAAGRAIRGLR